MTVFYNRATRMRRPIAQRPYRKPLLVWFPPPRPLHSPVARTLHAKPVSFIGQTQPYNGLEIYRIWVFSNIFEGFAPWLATLAPAPPFQNIRSSVCARGRRVFWAQRHKSCLFEQQRLIARQQSNRGFDKFDLERARSTPVFSVRSARPAENTSNVPSRYKCPNLCHYLSLAGAIVSLWPQAVLDLF